LVGDTAGAMMIRDDVTDALENLGYDKDDIMSILPHVIGETSEERVKSALKMIGKHR
jgi:Holliday junction resolvasome RuvABC DNA-binding subunit